MIGGKRVTVVLPAYNAARTLRATYDDIPHEIVDDLILTDDASRDETVALAKDLGIYTLRHKKNRGYGANQKTCYSVALERGAEIVVMLHPDYQYAPKLVTAMASMIASGEYDVVLGSRMLGRGARVGGMPLYKYIANRILTGFQNFVVRQNLSEYHTGYRAWSREVLEALPLKVASDDFVFDNQMLVQAIHWGFRIGEISCPTRYFDDASSINFRRSVTYGIGVVHTCVKLLAERWGIPYSPLFAKGPERRLVAGVESGSNTVVDHAVPVAAHGTEARGRTTDQADPPGAA